MTRMSREFSLVLLGAGILTAGYFAAPAPADEIDKKADEKGAARTGHNRTHYHGGGGFMLLYLHSPSYAGGPNRSPASPHSPRGGFGGSGRSAGAGGS